MFPPPGFPAGFQYAANPPGHAAAILGVVLAVALCVALVWALWPRSIGGKQRRERKPPR